MAAHAKCRKKGVNLKLGTCCRTVACQVAQDVHGSVVAFASGDFTIAASNRLWPCPHHYVLRAPLAGGSSSMRLAQSSMLKKIGRVGYR